MHGIGLGRAELPFPSFFLSLLILDPCYLYFLACFLCFSLLSHLIMCCSLTESVYRKLLVVGHQIASKPE
jgi:hypothetical protein